MSPLMQKGESMQNILIVNISGTGNEAEALRQTLENMNYFVCIKNIGHPKDFTDILSGKLLFDPDCIIVSCHGHDGKIIMPTLGDSLYETNEPKGDFSCEEIRRFIDISGKVIINLGCTTGSQALADTFSANNIYIAPTGYIDGNAALFFAIRLFYELTSRKCDIKDAYLSAKKTDHETHLFCMQQNKKRI